MLNYLIMWDTSPVLRNKKIVDIISIAREQKMNDIVSYLSFISEEHQVGFLTPYKAFLKIENSLQRV